MARKKQSEIKYGEAQSTDIDFKTFYGIYAAQEGFDHIPEFHLDMIRFLEDEQNWQKNTGVIQCFRNGSKSSLVATWIAWKIARQPTLLFVVQSADDSLAQKMVSDVQKIITLHPACAHLLSTRNVWTARGFRVKGATSGRSWTMTAKGIMSNVTGSRADYLVYDDVEVPSRSATDAKREDLRTKISESSHLLNPNGRKLFIGTPHAFDSIYPELIEKGASSFKVPLLSNLSGEFPFCTGTSNWPERWTLDLILEKQEACTGKSEFFSQYQLIAVSADDSYLDPTQAKTYRLEPRYIEANGHKLYQLGDKKITGILAFWDPSMAKQGRDGSVLAIVFCTAGEIYIHRTVGLTGDADTQCLQAKKLLMEFNVPIVHIETNGVGALFPQIMLKHVRGLGIGVNGKHTSQSKSESIQTAYETPLSAGILYCSEQVMQSKFVSQLQDFNPRRMSGSDDFIDAPAKGIHLLPISVGRGVTHAPNGFIPHRNFSQDMEIARDYAFD